MRTLLSAPLPLSLLLPLLGMLAPGDVRAQQTHSVAATATVPLASPTGIGTRGLAFGVIMPDVAAQTTVDVVAAVDPVNPGVQSGEYRFDVTATHGLSFSVTTPTELTAGLLPPLPVSFDGGEYGGWCVQTEGAACALVSFDPGGGDQRVCAEALGDGSCNLGRSWPVESILSVYIGGDLTVPPTARAGVYTATITLTITQVY